MDLRKDLEILVLLYTLIAAINFLLSVFLTEFLTERFLSQMEGFSSVYTLIPFNFLMDYSGYTYNLVVGIWLFVIVRRENGNAIHWLVFGLLAHLYAAVIYLFVRISEIQSKRPPSAIP